MLQTFFFFFFFSLFLLLFLLLSFLFSPLIFLDRRPQQLRIPAAHVVKKIATA